MTHTPPEWILIGFLLDLLVPDPQWNRHPIRYVGRLIGAAEPPVRKLLGDGRLSGVCFTFLVTGVTTAVATGILYGAGWLGYWIHGAACVGLIYFGLSTASLAEESRKIVRSLRRNDLEGARKYTGFVVGRDTDSLPEHELCRAGVETVSEGTVDGVISPLFYLILGGVPGLAFFKAASTLDSMVGHKTERYLRFGWASARLDDVLNFIPARVSVPVISLASLLTRGDAANALFNGFREGPRLESPNAGFPEAAFAWSLGVRLGGENFYQGEPVAKPYFCEAGSIPGVEHVSRSIRLMTVSAAISFCFFFGIWYTLAPFV